MGNTLVIVGSGPIGMVSALLLKNHFDRVVLLERQSREGFLNKHGFTFPIVFSPAAISVLRRVGAWEAIESERSPFFGVVVHKRIFGRELTWTAKRHGVYSHWRNHIVASLHDRVIEEGIEVHFEAQVDGIDFTDNVCTETTLGDISFDLLLGADGIHSQTRARMAATHPDFAADEFTSTLLDHWYAYRLPAEGEVAEKFLGRDRGYSSNVYVDNLAEHADERFRVITTGMRQPEDEISVVVKFGTDISVDRARELNHTFFSSMVDEDLLDKEWDAGVAGKYEHLHVPTFHLGSSLLVGDAAHGLESTGDLINIGLSSVGSLAECVADHQDVPGALAEYDDTVGDALRRYAVQALRRSQEKINFEVAAFEVGALLRLNKHHPSLWGIYENDFEIRDYMDRYERDRRRVYARLGGLSVLASAGSMVVGAAQRRREASAQVVGRSPLDTPQTTMRD